MFWLLKYNKLNTSKAYMKCINQDIVIENRQLYQKKENVWYQFCPFNRVIDIKFMGDINLALLIITLSSMEHIVNNQMVQVMLPII